MAAVMAHHADDAAAPLLSMQSLVHDPVPPPPPRTRNRSVRELEYLAAMHNAAVAPDPPEDAVRLVVDFAAGSLVELLGMALVDRQFYEAAVQRFAHELLWFGGRMGLDLTALAERGAGAGATGAARRARHGGLPQLLVPQVAQEFTWLPDLLLSSPGLVGEAQDEATYAAFAPFAEDEALLHCQDCKTPVLKADDVISSNYRIMTGRAYLTSSAYNVTVSEETHEAHYTTGQYTVRNVSCERCSLRLGITYVGAINHQNNYKIGKFLVGQHLFVRPACCLLRSRRLPTGLPTPLCPRCKRLAVRGSLELVYQMTCGFQVGRTRRLYELLLRQHALETLAEQRGTSSRYRLLGNPRALVAWCLPLLRPQHAHAAKDLAHLGLPGVDALAPAPQLNPYFWQETLEDRLAMLACMKPAIQGEHLSSALTAVVRFVSAVCRVAQNAAPQGAAKPERVSMLLKLLPALVGSGHADALWGARALVLVVRREWVTASPHGGNSSTLTEEELEAIISAITARASAGILERAREMEGPHGDVGAVLPEEQEHQRLCPGGGCRLSPPVLAGAVDTADATDLEADPVNPVTADEDELLLQCLACGNPILKADDILSWNYRIMTGSAYLTRYAYNVRLSAESYEATYTSGQYTVRDVSCACCSARLGIVYISANDTANLYKVGKFLMGQDQLLLPPNGGVSLPKDEVALREQLYELMRHGGVVPGPAGVEALPGGGDHDPLVGLAAAPPPVPVQHPPRQRFIVTIKRYFRCILPTVHYVSAATPVWVWGGRPAAAAAAAHPVRQQAPP